MQRGRQTAPPVVARDAQTLALRADLTGNLQMPRQLTHQRKLLYYVGMGVSILGLLLFLSTFVSLLIDFERSANVSDSFLSPRFSGAVAPQPPRDLPMARAFIGMILIAGGAFIMRVGARGAAGSGLLLDPDKPRGDLEPYSRMAGGMLRDALDEAGLNPGAGASEIIIMLKCGQCGKLNEQDSKFCQECGRPI